MTNSTEATLMAGDAPLIRSIFQSVLGRQPDALELDYGLNIVSLPDGFRRYLSEIIATPEAVERVRLTTAVQMFVPPGHYYSPICDTSQLNRASFEEGIRARKITGIDMRREEQKKLFLDLAKHFPKVVFAKDPTPGARYHSNNDFYNVGDGTVLASLIRELKPKRIVEVGSGFSSAVMLDTLDAMASESGHSCHCTFVEPYPHRLRGVLKDADYQAVTIIEDNVQNVDPSVFSQLERGDILFLDTTHIFKTGSDVIHEVFEILPYLASGVIVHFHDFFYNFEYPAQWVFDHNRSWNEIYLIRAFLSYNDQFEIIFFNHQFALENYELVASLHPGMAGHPGGGLWLRRR